MSAPSGHTPHGPTWHAASFTFRKPNFASSPARSGAGEAGNVGALAAIMNAVVDALSPLGITHLDLPATRESVWRAIRNIPIVKAMLETRAAYRNADKP